MSRPCFHSALTLLLLLLSTGAWGQTFRGTLTGLVVDGQGAVIANASVQLANAATGLVLNDKSSKAGEFNFPELPVGTYELTVNFAGFQTKKIQAIDIAVTKVTNLKVELGVGSERRSWT